jgi:hypothetical protein
MADVIKFEFDRPVEVALRFTEPRVFPRQFDGGDDRHMFSTTDGRVMYVSPLTSARIKALRLAQGECFFICKRKNGRLTEYAVSRETSEPMAPARPPAPFKTNLPERAYYKPGLSPVEGSPDSRQSGHRPETAWEAMTSVWVVGCTEVIRFDRLSPTVPFPVVINGRLYTSKGRCSNARDLQRVRERRWRPDGELLQL